MAVEHKRMQQLRGAPADWAANDVMLLHGEIGVIYEGGRARIKIGDGSAAFSTLAFVGEQDDAARASAAANTQTLVQHDQRIATLEPLTNTVAGIAAQVGANVQALNAKQSRLPNGVAVGDLLLWDGAGWTTFEINAAQDSLIYYDAAQARWLALPRGPAGSVLTVSPIGRPAWQAATAVQITTLPLTGGSTLVDAFNAQKPTVAVGELLIVTFSGQASLYTGHPGSGISTATAGDFTALGASAAFATVSDLTNPAGGATNLSVSPALLNAWAANANFDAGTF